MKGRLEGKQWTWKEEGSPPLPGAFKACALAAKEKMMGLEELLVSGGKPRLGQQVADHEPRVL